MSALLRLLASPWAVVWLRWRLLGANARRLAAGRRSALAGAGYYLSVDEIPVEGVDYEPAELPAELLTRLDGMRAGLVDQARGTAVRRTRRRPARGRRAVSLAMAALVTFAALGAGATALVTGSTGVPAVDRLLGIYEEGRKEADPFGETGSSIQPRAGRVGPSLTVPLGVGDREVALATYVSRDGRVCWSTTDARDKSAGPIGSVRCVDPALLSERLVQHHGFVEVILGEAVVLSGFVGGDAVALAGKGPTGALRVHLGDPWAPTQLGGRAARPFLAFGEGIGRSPSADRVDDLLGLSKYDLRARLSDGDEVEISP